MLLNRRIIRSILALSYGWDLRTVETPASDKTLLVCSGLIWRAGARLGNSGSCRIASCMQCHQKLWGILSLWHSLCDAVLQENGQLKHFSHYVGWKMLTIKNIFMRKEKKILICTNSEVQTQYFFSKAFNLISVWNGMGYDYPHKVPIAILAHKKIRKFIIRIDRIWFWKNPFGLDYIWIRILKVV